MLNQILKFGLGIVLLTAAGCASSSSGGGVETRAYVETRDKADQKMEGGNYGYLVGTPKAPDRSNIRKTRQVYVLEFTKNPDVTVDELRQPVAPAAPVKINVPERAQRPSSVESSMPVIEPIYADPDLESAPEVSGGAMQEYVVERGDTLQKISKKFYGGYSKWNRIYEANKDIIPDPNRIKPGLTIRIPAL